MIASCGRMGIATLSAGSGLVGGDGNADTGGGDFEKIRDVGGAGVGAAGAGAGAGGAVVLCIGRVGGCKPSRRPPLPSTPTPRM